jgi:foldase protein PrsA
MKRLIAALVVSVLALAGCAGGNVGNYFAPTAAVVNGEKIPEGLVSAQFRPLVTNPENKGVFVGSKGKLNRLDAQREILSDLIRERLILQEASTLNISVTAEEVRAAVVQQVESQFQGDAYQKYLRENFLTEEFIFNYFQNQFLVQRIAEAVTKDQKISEGQVQEAFEANRAQYDQMAHLAHILICSDPVPAEQRCNITDADRQRAAEIVGRARAGEDFAKLAREFSVDPSAPQNGGDIGFHSPGRLVAGFDTVAFALAVGQISDPVETQLGIHVIKMIEKGRSLDSVREELTEELLTPLRNTAFQKWLTEKLRAARISVNPRFGRFDRTSLAVVSLAPRAEPLAPQQPPGSGPSPAPQTTPSPASP